MAYHDFAADYNNLRDALYTISTLRDTLTDTGRNLAEYDTLRATIDDALAQLETTRTTIVNARAAVLDASKAQTDASMRSYTPICNYFYGSDWVINAVFPAVQYVTNGCITIVNDRVWLQFHAYDWRFELSEHTTFYIIAYCDDNGIAYDTDSRMIGQLTNEQAQDIRELLTS